MIISLSAVMVLGLTSCDTPPSRESDELRYRLVVQYDALDGTTKEAGTVVTIRASQTYNYGAGTEGWGGLGCNLNGSAIPIPLESGTLFALLHVASGQCELIKNHFDIPNGGDSGAWVGQWYELSQSNRKANLERDSLPLFIFVPAGKTIRDARPVYRQDFGRYGIKDITASVEVTQEPKTRVPPIITQVLSVDPNDEWEERYNVNDTNRFAPGLLAINEES